VNTGESAGKERVTAPRGGGMVRPASEKGPLRKEEFQKRKKGGDGSSGIASAAPVALITCAKKKAREKCS